MGRIRELEVELGNVQAHTGENAKGYQKSERRAKDLAFQIEEDKKNQDRMSDLANKLQAKIKTYKKQIEEAEEIAALNLAKFRKAQQELEETRREPGWLRVNSPPSDIRSASHDTCHLNANDDPSMDKEFETANYMFVM